MFYDTNLTYGATFLTALIKRAKSRFNQQIKFPRDTNQRINEIAIKCFWNAHMCVRNVTENFFSNENFSVDYQNLLDYHTSVTRKISGIMRQSFNLGCLMSQITDPL